MTITRRDTLMGATVAAVVSGTATSPRSMKAAPAGDPVIALARRLRAASEAWASAEDTFENACHHVGFDVCAYDGLVPVDTLDGPCCWGASEIREAAEDGRDHDWLTPDLCVFMLVSPESAGFLTCVEPKQRIAAVRERRRPGGRRDAAADPDRG